MKYRHGNIKLQIFVITLLDCQDNFSKSWYVSIYKSKNMLELVNINRLEPSMFIVNVTEQVAEGNINNLDEIDDVSLEVIQQHHERLDGSGYLDGLRGQQISLYGKMAAIVDTYDSLITSRPYREALKPADALKKMKDGELGLDKELIYKFIGYRY
jgi:hypothetical protein